MKLICFACKTEKFTNKLTFYIVTLKLFYDLGILFYLETKGTIPLQCVARKVGKSDQYELIKLNLEP